MSGQTTPRRRIGRLLLIAAVVFAVVPFWVIGARMAVAVFLAEPPGAAQRADDMTFLALNRLTRPREIEAPDPGDPPPSAVHEIVRYHCGGCHLTLGDFDGFFPSFAATPPQELASRVLRMTEYTAMPVDERARADLQQRLRQLLETDPAAGGTLGR